MVAGLSLLTVVWLFLLRYVPDTTINTQGGFVPNRSDLLDVFIPPTVFALLFLLTFGILGGWLLAGRMLAPLERITQATRLVAGGKINHRIAMQSRNDEFGELAIAFDRMLDQIESYVSQQQRFAANASHELRTPLAIMQTVIEVAEKEPNHSRSAVLARLKETNRRAVELVEALLLLSRAENTINRVENVDLSLLLDEAVEVLLPLAEQRRINVTIDASPCQVRGSSSLILQMITNLLHNAIVHNLSEGGQIRASTLQTADYGSLTVANTGAMMDRTLVNRLTEPFMKGTDRTRVDGSQGTGLGLSIVENIVKSHAGTLHLAAQNNGGMLVQVTIPAYRTPLTDERAY